MGWIVKDSVHMYGGGISMRDSCSQHAHIYVYTGAESESDDGFYDFAGDSAAAPVKRKHTAEAEKAYERGKVKSDVLLIGLGVLSVSTCARHLPLGFALAMRSQRIDCS